MKALLSLITVSFIFFPTLASAAQADKKFMVEFHMGAASPEESIGDIQLDTGGQFGVSMAYNIVGDSLGVYVDLGGDGFEASSASDDRVESVALVGVGVGLTNRGLFPGGRIGYYSRLGVHFSELVVMDKNDKDINKSGSKIGLQTSLGLSYKLSDKWALRTGVKYRKYSDSLDKGNNIDAELDSLSGTVGASYRF